MSTPHEKVEAQRLAWNHLPIQPWHRHLVGPEELDHLLFEASLLRQIVNDLKQIKIHLGTEPTTPKDPK